MTQRRQSLALFCRVVDNFGDIGICWRLAQQFESEHGLDVTLWVDDLQAFARICPAVEVAAETQQLAGITVRHWRDQQGEFSPAGIADIVIEFFAVDLPPAYIAAMALWRPQPVWLNLEGLTAEAWVEGCHRLPSMHPRLPLTKHFFFPGFNAKTGGLLCEAGLEQARAAFLADTAGRRDFLRRLGLTSTEMEGFTASLFCYPHAPVAALFEAWSDGDRAVTCLVPEGVAVDAVAAFLGSAAVAGAARTVGALTVRVIPFVPQPDYDKLLWSCDFNFVRGEDSFVRAHWAQKPFAWHIYPQDEQLHHKKLRAFLNVYAAGSDSLAEFSLAWNDAGQGSAQAGALWPAVLAGLPEMVQRAGAWAVQMRENGDLAGNLLKFAASFR